MLRHRERDWETEKEYIWITSERQTDRQTDKQTDPQAGRQRQRDRDRQTNRRTDRRTDGQTNRQTECIGVCMCMCVCVCVCVCVVHVVGLSKDWLTHACRSAVYIGIRNPTGHDNQWPKSAHLNSTTTH